MSKKRILFVTQEMKPYTAISEISEVVKSLPQYTHEKGIEIRVLMPRFGTINERRHRLHEVVRLSGMNIIVDDDDYPLIIKVASLPGARLQVYFLDNEEFFKRKSIFEDAEGKAFDDNIDRMVFFCKGVIETVKKFGWAPDIVHCHGWMTSLVPLYLKTAYAHEPLFENSKVIYSVYDSELIPSHIDKDFVTKAAINNLDTDKLAVYENGGGVNLDKGAITYSDAVIQGSETIENSVSEEISKQEKPQLAFTQPEEYLATYLDFYKNLME